MEEFWKKYYQSVCKITHLKNGEPIASGTGFVVNGFLITNNHVYFSQITDSIRISFVQDDSFTISKAKEFDYQVFQQNLVDGEGQNGWDFAILKLDDHFKKIPSLNLAINDESLCIGRKIGILGYPFDQDSLTLHSGYISSQFIKNSVKYIQIDASINNGNSGGPLIDYLTGDVIGIVTRKGTGLTNMFQLVKNGIVQSLRYLDSLRGVQAQLSGLDLMQGAKVTQTQMLAIFNEIERSANVGIGFAFKLDKIRTYFET